VTRATFDRGAKVRRWERNLAKPTAALKRIGVLMVAESQRSFKTQRLGRNVWPSRAPINVFGIIADFAAGKRAPPQRRFQRRPALRDTGRLAASISFRLVGTDSVEVGSNLPYAAVHQSGGETQSEPITQKVRDLLWRWLKGPGSAYKRRLGWLLNRKFKDQRLTGNVPQRKFVGITKTLLQDVKSIVGVSIMEAE
jgi:phage gpG-like protein